jgi:hypothetical protein
MNNRKPSFYCRLAALSLFCCLTGLSAQAQNAKPLDENLTIQSLLNEVHMIRQRLQRSGLNAYRSQIILEPLRAQHEIEFQVES